MAKKLADAVVYSKISSRIDCHLVKATELESKYWHEVLQHMIDVIVFLSTQGLALCGHDEIIGSFHNGNFLGIIELQSKYDPFLTTHIQKYGNKGHRSISCSPHGICDELINIMGKSVIKIILKEVQESQYFSISVDSTTDITHTDQLCITLRYVLPSAPVGRFVIFVPIKSHTWLGIAEVILTFLQRNSIDIKYCHSQSYSNASNMSGKYKGVQQRIKDVCSYTEFCQCFAHLLNLVGSCTVKAKAAAANFFLMIQQLKFFSSSTYLWEILEDMLKNTATKHKLLAVKHLSDTHWSTRYDAVCTLAFRYNDYINLLKAISADEGNCCEVQNDAKGLVKRLS